MKEVSLKQLLNTMTIDEKIGQLIQLAPFFFQDSIKGEITGPMRDIGIDVDKIKYVGNVLGIGGAKEKRMIQEDYLAHHPNKIPLLFMGDIIHGYKTIFPIPLALGCSWNKDLVKETARVAAKEASVAGLHVTFSPMVDLVKDPRWGRVMESTGEDPYLNGEFAESMVLGYQSESLDEVGTIAACVKHFAAYGAPEGGRDYNTVDMSKRVLMQYYLPAYQKALDAGAKMVMTSFNSVDGIPATGNRWLLKGILRDSWKFNGVTVSDYGSVVEMVEHRTAENKKDAAKQAFNATLDIEMMSGAYVNHLKTLIENNEVEKAFLDESVYRILSLKNELGLFENPYRFASEEKEKTVHLSKEHRALAKRSAHEASVLLKNDSLLPLNEKQNIVIIGPYSDEHSIMGPWSWQGSETDTISLKQGIEAIIKRPVKTASGTNLKGELTNFDEAITLAKEADVVILALGEPAHYSGEGGSRTNIKLPGKQESLLEAIHQLSKPIVSVLFNGRPLDIKNLNEKSNAILEAWFPGTEGGNALAELLYGYVNPSGRLTMSFPRNVGQVPVYYNHFSTGRPKKNHNYNRYVSHYLDEENSPLYPFGFGLSYTNFEYGTIQASSHVVTEKKGIEVSVEVTNTGKVAGKETVQLYIRDDFASVIRPVKELKGFKQIELNPQEKRTVTFKIKDSMLGFIDQSLNKTVEPGTFKIYVGNHSETSAFIEITYKNKV